MLGGIFQLLAYGSQDIYLGTTYDNNDSAKIIQKAWRKLQKRNNAAKIIQKGCKNWLQKIICRDNKYGIWYKLSIKNLQEIGMFSEIII